MKKPASKSDKNPPVFQSWSAWYLAVLLVNILVVFAIYLYVNTL